MQHLGKWEYICVLLQSCQPLREGQKQRVGRERQEKWETNVPPSASNIRGTTMGLLHHLPHQEWQIWATTMH